MAARPRKSTTEPPRTEGSRAERLAVLLFFSTVMFVLGVVVGRGTVPVEVAVPDVDARLATLYPEEAEEIPAEPVTLDVQTPLQSEGIDIPGAPIEILPKVTGEKKRLPQVTRRPVRLPDPPPEPVAEVKRAAPEAPGKPEPPTPTEGTAVPAGTAFYTLQLSAHKSPETAAREARRYRQNGLPVYVATGEGKGGRTWYRVRVGKARTAEELASVRERLAAIGMTQPVLYKETAR